MNLPSVLPFILLPTVATTVAGVFGAFRPLGPRVGSAIQHFAAGAILAAVAAELLPEALRGGRPGPLTAGFVLAFVLMLAVQRLAKRFGPRGEQAAGPRDLIVVSGVDTLIDGILLGIGFAAGVKQGTLLAVALTLETLSPGLSAAAALHGTGAARWQIIVTTAVLSLLFAVGGIGGVALVGGVQGPVRTALFAFGAAVLLYLAGEELLVEAHEAPETVVAKALFLGGFLLLMLIDLQG